MTRSMDLFAGLSWMAALTRGLMAAPSVNELKSLLWWKPYLING